MSIKQFAPILDVFSIGPNSVVYQDSQNRTNTTNSKEETNNILSSLTYIFPRFSYTTYFGLSFHWSLSACA